MAELLFWHKLGGCPLRIQKLDLPFVFTNNTLHLMFHFSFLQFISFWKCKMYICKYEYIWNIDFFMNNEECNNVEIFNWNICGGNCLTWWKSDISVCLDSVDLVLLFFMSASDGVHWEYRNFTKLGPPRLYNVGCMHAQKMGLY